MRRIRSFVSATLSILLAFAGFSQAAEIRVPGDYATIQAAIDAAAAGDVVRVDAGTYFERIDFLGKAIRVESVEGPEVTVIDAEFQGTAVMFVSSETADSVIEGFTIRQGGPTTSGGGVRVQGASPTIRGNIIEDNKADFGGGISCDGGAGPLILENLIRDNTGRAFFSLEGGGIYCGNGSAPHIEGNKITRNQADYGGNIACLNLSSPFIFRNHIAEGWTQSGGGGISARMQSSPLIQENEITRNVTELYGAGLYVTETGDASELVVVGNRIAENDSETYGGGVSIFRASASLRGNEIVENFGDYGGGGIHFSSAMHSREEFLALESNRIERNESEGRGAGLEFYTRRSDHLTSHGDRFVGNVAASGGGAIALDSADATLSNTIFVGNSSRDRGGALDAYRCNLILSNVTMFDNSVVGRRDGGGAYIGYERSTSIVNSILWGNRARLGDQIWPEDGSIDVSHSIVEGGFVGEAILDTDPLFVDSASGDYHLRLDSPAVDAGTNLTEWLPETDIDGDPRVLNGNAAPPEVVDLGADELVPEIALRFGFVNGAEPVLTVNGSRGDYRRVLGIELDEPVSIEMRPSTAGPKPARFVAWAWLEAPDATTLRPQPRGLGWTVFPIPLQGESVNQPVEIWNNLGFETQLGVPTRRSIPAPSVLTRLQTGFSDPIRFTIQGLIEDLGSRADGPFSITNAVIIDIR